MRTPIAAIFISALAAALPATAFASDVEFAYAARDLSNSASIARLYERLEEKASDACALYENSGLLALQYRRACAAELTAELVAKIGDGTLAALHEERHAGRYAENR